MLVETVSKSVRLIIRQFAVFLNNKTKGRVSPNLITTLSTAGHLPVVFFIMTDQLLVAGIVFIFFGLFDVLDGELARLQKSAGPKGMVYDASSDRIKEVLIFSATTYYISQSSTPEWSFIAALALGASLSVSYAKAKAEVSLTIKKRLSDHHKINRHFSEGVASFEIRMALMALGMLSGNLLLATSIVAALSTFAMFERLYFYLKRI
ncbi:MAG: CDP-alcohol phosphatidyltransferase family protein [Candidatus Saccharimonadales bacterium]